MLNSTPEAQTSLPTEHEVLVVGVDGSGKSTFLEAMHDNLGYAVLEPTSTSSALEFKNAHLETLVDTTFVDQREALFLGLNMDFKVRVHEAKASTGKVATTGDTLVTMLSHAVMKDLVSSDERPAAEQAVQTWLSQSNQLPDAITLVHAPDETILGRIVHRQQSGQHNEKFWGFNAPLFLCLYQDSWLTAIEIIRRESDVTCLQLDTSIMRSPAMIDAFIEAISEDPAG